MPVDLAPGGDERGRRGGTGWYLRRHACAGSRSACGPATSAAASTSGAENAACIRFSGRLWSVESEGAMAMTMARCAYKVMATPGPGPYTPHHGGQQRMASPARDRVSLRTRPRCLPRNKGIPLRLFLLPPVPHHPQLVWGHAEIFGAELAEGKSYLFGSECKAAVFTWHGCTIQMSSLSPSLRPLIPRARHRPSLHRVCLG